ncbi:MAG: HAD family hydrolase [Chlorobi bacterium]|nr:MAG: HAD hydrolase-like protein [Bacteroidota bacterium]MBE2266454.1 HAD hydrolase-like protein [Flavobacteriales bacterium]MBL1160425.1 HAD family hydrolase [Chlorobiota bacterium]MBW7853570.1 HAD hydrolase-like protein [Candidatus Kapabacteria bacterium]MCC6331183.1 HAD hydrolase-like protein [Ignavibacteria bacterium]
MMLPELLMFDLDGTLLDSRAGIEHSLRLTLAGHGVDLASDVSISWCIGTSLYRIFEHFMETTSEERINSAIAMYRRIYRDGPMYNYQVYSGVPETLEFFRQVGVRIVIATAKANEQAWDVVRTTSFAHLIDHVYGTDPNEGAAEKRDLIRLVLQNEATASTQAVMVGDRHHDINGAADNNVTGIAAAYGYGSEHEYSRATAIISHPAELVHVLGNLSR